jgi:hypothetical protein
VIQRALSESPESTKRLSLVTDCVSHLAALVIKRAPLNKKKNRKAAGHVKHPDADPDLVDGWDDVVDTTKPATEAEAVKKINKGWAKGALEQAALVLTDNDETDYAV